MDNTRGRFCIYILSVNINRRHMSAAQRAMAS